MRTAALPPIDRFAVLSHPPDDLSGELDPAAGALAERPQLPRRTLVLEDHFVGSEDVQLTVAVPIDRLRDPLNQRSQLRLVIGSNLLTRSPPLSLRTHGPTVPGA
ncbi:hypothetical protein GCM10009745_00840 [Kribbella yunnanensis]|uniref:Uncharacterized protein n=1 Tax=Kribbella yunnanensis TaxID=190194 RepID=A0ABP4RWA2_9ACTN